MYIKITFYFFLLSLFIEAKELNIIKKSQNITKTNIENIINETNNLNITKHYMNKYYKNFGYKLFWFNENKIKTITKELIQTIKTDEVLKPVLDNKLSAFRNIEKQLSDINNAKKDKNPLNIIDLDIKLTNIYHQYMRFLINGLINWEDFESELLYKKEVDHLELYWQKYIKYINIRKLLYKIVQTNTFINNIEQLNNQFFYINILNEKIQRYKQIKSDGGFVKTYKSKPYLTEQSSYKEIKPIRKRLLQSDDLEDFSCSFDETFCDELFDKYVFEAVKKFQKRHGLIVDGIIGNNTIKALNIPIEEKLEKLRLSIERIRLLPQDFGDKFIYINIPEYKLRVYDKKEKSFETAVIVGKKQNPTPIFSHKMSEIVINPYWRIPQSIVKKELIEKFIENPNYLKEENIKVFENWDINSMEYDVSSVDWSMYLDNDLVGDDKEAPMRFIQFPNKRNPLGKMKFMFPNRYSVYLHDTPNKDLFETNIRAYSHGCIRVDKPTQLLLDILKKEKIYEGMDYKQLLGLEINIDLELEEKIPVHIVYLTSWIDEQGEVNFRDDIYDLDKIQTDILYNPNYERKEIETKTLSVLN